jgi:hypothetical protein
MLVAETDAKGEWYDHGDKFSEENIILFENSVMCAVSPRLTLALCF